MTVIAAATAALAAAAATNLVYESGVATNRAWVRAVVSEMHEGGEVRLMDRRRKFVARADQVAEEYAATNAHRVAEAWTRGFAEGTNALAAAMNASVTNATYTEWQIVDAGSDAVEIGEPGEDADTAHVFVDPILWTYDGGGEWTLWYDYWQYGGGEWECYAEMEMKFVGGADALSMTDAGEGTIRAERTRGPDRVDDGPPTNGVAMKLLFPLKPSVMIGNDSGIFVVSNEYDAVRNRDAMLIYYNTTPPMKPIMKAPYVYGSGSVTNRVTGRFTVPDVPNSHWTNTVTVTRFGQIYSGCRWCWFDRPAALAGETVMMNRHGRFGGVDGIEWGRIAVKVLNEMAYTGEVTNAAEGVVATFSNGAFMGTYQIGGGDEQE